MKMASMQLPQLIFIAPLSGLTTGMSLASKRLREYVDEDYEVFEIDLSANNSKATFSKIISYIKIIISIIKINRNASPDAKIYFTVSESFLSAFKDIVILSILWPRLSNCCLHLHGGNGLLEILKNSLVFRFIVSKLWSRCAHIIVLANYFKFNLESYGIKSSTSVVDNFFDDFLLFDNRINIKNISHSPINILFLSNFFTEKGYWDLANALRVIKLNDDFNFHFHLAGSFLSEQQRAAMIAFCEENFQGCYTYYGFVEGGPKRDLLQRSQIFCLPTYYRYEGQPISIIEAYAAGCAVLTTSHAGIPEIFEDCVNGFEVEKRSPESIRVSLNRLNSDRELLGNIMDANISFARNRFSLSNHLSAVSGLLKD